MFRLLVPALLSCCLHLVAEQSRPLLPSPTGPKSVGETSFLAGGETVILWYPAQQSGQPAAYAGPALLAELEKSGYYEQKPETIRSWSAVKTHSTKDATPVSGRFPLLIFLPGAGVYGFQYTAIAEEFASHGYIVALVDYFSSQAPKRAYGEDDSAAMENDMARSAVETLKALQASTQWQSHVRVDRVGVAGHSIGGAAAIAAARVEKKITAAADMDGAPFGESVHGTVVPLLVLRSKPIYSDADLAKRGQTREEWDKKGQQVRTIWLGLESNSGQAKIEIWSVKGTGHFSFSDAPFVMPDAITRFGGTIIDPQLGHKVITSCLLEFFGENLGASGGRPGQSACSSYPEIAPGIPPEIPQH